MISPEEKETIDRLIKELNDVLFNASNICICEKCNTLRKMLVISQVHIMQILEIMKENI